MPRLVTRSWNGIPHTSIDHGPKRSRHLGEQLGQQLSSEEISEAEARQGIKALVTARELPGGGYGGA